MAARIIPIDLEAYELLLRHKSPGQSTSQVSQQHLGKVRTGGDLRRALDRISLSEETLDAIEEQIIARGDSKPAYRVSRS
jgi:predicted CopG family antitoxin